MRTIFFDLETDKKLNITVAVAQLFESKKRLEIALYPKSDKKDILKALKVLKIFLNDADIIVIYNGLSFDIEILKKYYSQRYINQWLKKLIDPFDYMKTVYNSYVSLDRLAKINNIKGKLKCFEYIFDEWENKKYEYALQYCRQDVFILKNLWNLKSINIPILEYNQIIKIEKIDLISTLLNIFNQKNNLSDFSAYNT